MLLLLYWDLKMVSQGPFNLTTFLLIYIILLRLHCCSIFANQNAKWISQCKVNRLNNLQIKCLQVEIYAKFFWNLTLHCEHQMYSVIYLKILKWKFRINKCIPLYEISFNQESLHAPRVIKLTFIPSTYVLVCIYITFLFFLQ